MKLIDLVNVMPKHRDFEIKFFEFNYAYGVQYRVIYVGTKKMFFENCSKYSNCEVKELNINANDLTLSIEIEAE